MAFTATPDKPPADRSRAALFDRLVVSFEVAGRTVFVRPMRWRCEGLHTALSIYWRPDKPERLTPAEIATFDRERGAAVRELCRMLKEEGLG